MILSFKPQFVKPILDGTKIHTIREDPHNRWNYPKKIHFATGVRTKNYNCFLEKHLHGTQHIEMIFGFGQTLQVKVDSDLLLPQEVIILADKDGFSSSLEFYKWFEPLVSKAKNNRFHAKLIHWTDYRY